MIWGYHYFRKQPNKLEGMAWSMRFGSGNCVEKSMVLKTYAPPEVWRPCPMKSDGTGRRSFPKLGWYIFRGELLNFQGIVVWFPYKTSTAADGACDADDADDAGTDGDEGATSPDKNTHTNKHGMRMMMMMMMMVVVVVMMMMMMMMTTTCSSCEHLAQSANHSVKEKSWESKPAIWWAVQGQKKNMRLWSFKRHYILAYIVVLSNGKFFGVDQPVHVDSN